MDTEDKTLIAAYAIVTYADILDELNELADLQAPVPHVLVGRIREQLTQLSQLWWANIHGDPVWRDGQLALVRDECRDWVAEHSARLTELTERKVEPE